MDHESTVMLEPSDAGLAAVAGRDPERECNVSRMAQASKNVLENTAARPHFFSPHSGYSKPTAMALISATTIIRSLAIFHLTIAYFLLTSPSTIVDQNLVYILGAAMDLVCPLSSASTSLHSLSLPHILLSLSTRKLIPPFPM